MLSIPIPWRTFAEVEPSQKYLVMASRLPLRSYRKVPAFLRLTSAVRKQLGGAEGLVGYSLLAQPLTKSFFTLSAWRSQDHLDAFARALPHSAIVAELRPHMAPTTFVFWWVPGTALPIAWDAAMERLSAAVAHETGGHHHMSEQRADTGVAAAVVDPAAAGLRVEWASEPAAPLPGEPVTVIYRIIDGQSGEAITDLPIDHERPMHLIVVGRDLTEFQHIHPERGEGGAYRVTTTLPRAGTYLLYNEFGHDGLTVLDRRQLVIGQPSTTAPALALDTAPKTVDGLTVAVTGPETIRAGEAARFVFEVTRDGRPVTDLAPYLGAAAHVAIVSEDGTDFAHTHGEVVAEAPEHDGHDQAGAEGHSAGDGAHALPPTFGPRVGMEHTFAAPGLYKIWAQFGHDGQVVTIPFVVEVR